MSSQHDQPQTAHSITPDGVRGEIRRLYPRDSAGVSAARAWVLARAGLGSDLDPRQRAALERQTGPGLLERLGAAEPGDRPSPGTSPLPDPEDAPAFEVRTHRLCTGCGQPKDRCDNRFCGVEVE